MNLDMRARMDAVNDIKDSGEFIPPGMLDIIPEDEPAFDGLYDDSEQQLIMSYIDEEYYE